MLILPNALQYSSVQTYAAVLSYNSFDWTSRVESVCVVRVIGEYSQLNCSCSCDGSASRRSTWSRKQMVRASVLALQRLR